MLNRLLENLIKIDSSTKMGANKAIDFCRQWLVNHHLSVLELENNGYKMLVCEIGSGDQTIIFNGHVDVVSGKREQFNPIKREGKLYGRGAADMKAGVAAMMCALVKLKDLKLHTKVQLQIVSDEEIGGFNCSGYLVEKGYLGDFVICAEPTQLGIGLQAKGILQIDIEISGKSAHSSRPWEGVNAIEKAYEVYQKIVKLPFMQESSVFYSFPSINLAKIHGGDVYNKVPERCSMSFDIRFLPTQSKDEIIAQIKETVDDKVSVRMDGEAVRTDPDNPFIMTLRPIIKKYTKKEVVIFGQHGAADTRFYSALGIPAIEFGPSGANWHGDEEYIILDSVYHYQKMLVEFVLQCKK